MYPPFDKKYHSSGMILCHLLPKAFMCREVNEKIRFTCEGERELKSKLEVPMQCHKCE
jgi:hypothetical protein